MIELLIQSEFDFDKIPPPEEIILGKNEKKSTNIYLNYKPVPWIIMAASQGDLCTVKIIWNQIKKDRPKQINKLLYCTSYIGKSPIRKNNIIGNCLAAAILKEDVYVVNWLLLSLPEEVKEKPVKHKV
jgi:hypothetical protein